MSEIPRIITADCSFPKEIDDGLFVEKMDEDHELYRVGVCVVDTAKVYTDDRTRLSAFQMTEAKYYDLPGGERGYDPMIEERHIKSLEFTAGNVRDALIVTFLVGRKTEPQDVEASFGRVEIARNMSYKDFANYSIYGGGKRFNKASEFIRGHLAYTAYGDHAGSRPAWRTGVHDQESPGRSEKAWKTGSKINEAFMVATNHLIGKLIAEEGRPAIYRVHDPEDERHIEIVSASAALFSRIPGPHAGLGLDPYCRVTSPLRRLDDFVMNNQLKKRFLGKAPTAQDISDVAFAVRRLNQEVIASAPKDISRFSRKDVLGRTALHSIPSSLAAG